MKNRLRHLLGPRAVFGMVASLSRHPLRADLDGEADGMHLWISFLTRRHVHLTAMNESLRPMDGHLERQRVLFFTRDGRCHELLTEDRTYDRPEILPGETRTYPLELSLAESSRITPQTTAFARGRIGGKAFCLLPA